MGKLSDVQIRNWVKAGKPIAKADGDGLNFTLSAKGTASWTLRYRFAGKPRELTIGRYPDVSLAEARRLAANARAKVQQGIDVAREKQKTKVEAATAMTVRQLATDYMGKRFPSLKRATVDQRRRYIQKWVLPKLGALAARKVGTADVVALIARVGEKASAHVAEQVYTALSEIFKHGMARHVVTANPCAGISVRAIAGNPPPARKRLNLTADELHAILREAHTMGEANALALKLLIITGVRTGELARAKWEHVDLERAEWLVPDDNSKGARGFTVPLPPTAVECFRQLKQLAGDSGYVLPARSARRRQRLGGDAHYEQRTLNAQLHKLTERVGCRRCTPHDMRSTARSHLAALGVDVLVAERCLNHTLGGLVAVYDQHDYIRERRDALEKLAAFITACEAGEEWNVIPLRCA
jgi:integrase